MNPMMNILKPLIQHWQRRAPRPAPDTRTITEAELVARFRSAPGNPLYTAVLAVLDDQILEVSVRPLNLKLPAPEKDWHLGAQDGLIEFKERLLHLEDQARQQNETASTPGDDIG